MNAHSGARFLTDTYEPDEDDDEPETTLDTGAVKTLDALRNSIAAVVDYSFRAEHADYERQRPENREGHVFEHLRTLRRFLTGDAVTPAGEPEPDDHSSRQEDGRNAADDLERVLTRAIADARALDAIAHMLRDPDWGVGILEDAAAIVSETGRSLDNPTGEATWPRPRETCPAPAIAVTSAHIPSGSTTSAFAGAATAAARRAPCVSPMRRLPARAV